ncbi:MAG: hypothetical protein D6815_03840, partial [Candidatus Dadabacteria bacterium]
GRGHHRGDRDWRHRYDRGWDNYRYRHRADQAEALREALVTLFYALGFPARGFYCKCCHFRAWRPDSFYDHLRRHHRVGMFEVLSHLRWSPQALVFVFDLD